MQHKITYFTDLHNVVTPWYHPVEWVLDRIKNGNSKDLIESIRENKDDKAARNELKKKLPAICFSGEFTKRNDKSIVEHSGLICLDFDGYKTKKETQEMKDLLSQDEYVYSVFISPSGYGLKVLVKIPQDIDNHKRYFNALEEFYDCEEFDTSCKNISRVCYESYDPKIYINPDSKVWTEMASEKSVEIDRRQNTSSITVDDSNGIITRIMAWFNKNYDWNSGGRNNNMYVLAAAFNQYGIIKAVADVYLMQFAQPGGKDAFPESEVQKTIDQAYLNVSDFNTKAFEDKDAMDDIRREIKQGASKKEIKEELIQKGIDENKADAILNRAGEAALENVQKFWNKSDKGAVTLAHHLFREFLQDNGFYKFYPEGSNSFIFVRRISNRVINTTEQTIKDFVLDYVMYKVKDMHVYNFFADKTRFFKEDFLSMLPEIEINFVEDSIDESYLFFKNVAVKVTPDTIEPIQYENLPGWVWEDQMIDRDFSECDGNLCEFRQFIKNISGYDNSVKTQDMDTAKRIQSVESTIGFLLHSYKPHSYCPAVILNDEVISDNPEGGTGKGIFATAIGHLRKGVSIDGKGFNFDRSFAYQTVQQDTQVLVFDDVRANFNFERLFSVITEGITLEKKNKDAIKLPFEKSPKIIITTNYAIRGSGNSFDRRKWELEFKQFYRKDFTPREEFGHDLFTGWNESEWCIFDNYMIGCLQFYLQKGFVKSKFKNLKARKFVADTSHEFYEWMEDKDNKFCEAETRYHVQNVMNEFVQENPDYDKKGKHQITNRRFKTWLKLFGEYKFGAESIDGRDATGVWVEFKKPRVKQEKLNV